MKCTSQKYRNAQETVNTAIDTHTHTAYEANG